jgi:hypothetical protein
VSRSSRKTSNSPGSLVVTVKAANGAAQTRRQR